LRQNEDPVRAEEDPDAGARDSPNYPDLMVLKGGAAVARQAALVPLSDDAGKVEAVREGVTRVIALDYVPPGDKSNPILSGVMNAPIVPASAIIEACGGNRALIGRRAGWPCWRRLGCRTRGSIPTVVESDN
jgi:hypothetical protein